MEFKVRKSVKKHFTSRKKYPEPTLSDRIETALTHYLLFRRIKEEIVALREFRKYLGNYVSGFRNAKNWRVRLMECNDEKDFFDCLQKIKKIKPKLKLAV